MTDSAAGEVRTLSRFERLLMHPLTQRIATLAFAITGLASGIAMVLPSWWMCQ